MRIYRTKEGDTLASVAREQHILPTLLAETNGLCHDEPLTAKEALLIRTPKKTTEVQEGETIKALTRRTGKSEARLRQLNPALQEGLYPGMTLTLSTEDEGRGELAVMGCLHPETDKAEYAPLLPYLSFLSLLGWTLKNGEPLPPKDREAVAAAREAGVMPLACLVAEGEERAALAALLEKNEARPLADHLALLLKESGYGGVMLDLGKIKASECAGYIAFLGRLRSRLGHMAMVVAVLPPDGEDSLLSSIGRAASAVFLETNALSSRFLPPSPEAPYDKVAAAVERAASLIRPQKLLMGLSTRALDFPVGGGEAGRWLTAKEIGKRAPYGERGFDPQGRVPYLSYREGEKERIAFYEDAESIYEKLLLAECYGIGGVALFPLIGTDIRLMGLLAELYRIEKPYGL